MKYMDLNINIRSRFIFSSLYQFLGLFLLMVFSTSTNAQSFEEWIEAVNSKTKSLDNVETKIDVKAIDNESGQETYQTSFLLKRKGEKFYYTLENIEIINDGTYQVTANHEFKIISFFKMNGDPSGFQPEIMSLDSILNYYSNPIKVSEDQYKVQFSVSQKNSLVKEILITVDKQQMQINKIAYDYHIDPLQADSDKNRVEMTLRTKALTGSDLHYFDLDKYIRIDSNKDQVQLTDRFKDYNLETIN